MRDLIYGVRRQSSCMHVTVLETATRIRKVQVITRSKTWKKRIGEGVVGLQRNFDMNFIQWSLISLIKPRVATHMLMQLMQEGMS